MLRFAGEMAYRVGLGPRSSDEPDRRVVDVADELSPGRALDLGCGTGRNTLFLAARGWDVVGIDMVGAAVAAAGQRAESAGVRPRLVVGDVTRLDDLGIGDGYTLLVDAGCYHLVSGGDRDAYASGVSRAAAPGARLLMVGFTRLLGIEMNAAELLRRFPDWELVREEPVPAAEMRRYVSGPAPIRRVVGTGWFETRRYELRLR